MARMIPDVYPSGTQSTAERNLFTALEAGLDDDVTVLHGVPWLDGVPRYLQQVECRTRLRRGAFPAWARRGRNQGGRRTLRSSASKAWKRTVRS